MGNDADHARTLFSAIIPDRKDLLEIALVQLTPEHLTSASADSRWYNFFIIFQYYHSIAGDVLTRKGVSDALVKSAGPDVAKIRLYEETYDTLEATEASEADFHWALEQLKEGFARRSTDEALVQARQILSIGIEGPRGEEIKGHQAARDAVMARFSEIDMRLNVQDAPDGNAREEEKDILEEYLKKKEDRLAGKASGIEFGIPELDKFTGGLQPGELDFILGYSSSGKSSLAVQLAWWCSVMQGKNIVYVTTETLRAQIRRKLISRHSKMPQFEIPDGLNSIDLKRGTLSEDMEHKLRDVVQDFGRNPAYGQCRIMQASEGMTVSNMELRLQRLHNQCPIDLVIVDSLYILKPDTKRLNQREEYNQMIQKAKNIATVFDHGKGVPVVTPWQTSREHKERADRDKRYSMAAMSETSYAERYADIVISILEPSQVQRHTTLSCALLKNRDGEQSPNFDISVDYATSHFTDVRMTSSSSMNSLLGFS